VIIRKGFIQPRTITGRMHCDVQRDERQKKLK